MRRPLLKMLYYLKYKFKTLWLTLWIVREKWYTIFYIPYLSLIMLHVFACNSGICLLLPIEKVSMAGFYYVAVIFFFIMFTHWCLHAAFFPLAWTHKPQYCFLWCFLMESDCHQHKDQLFSLIFFCPLVVNLYICKY